MGEVAREIEGTWEEVRGLDTDLAGKRVRIQVFSESTVDIAADLRSLLKDTQRQAIEITEADIEEEVQSVRAARQCAS